MQVLRRPVRIRAAGQIEKSIFEYVGRMSGEERFSLARMESPAGWSEPGQRPDFQEITLILSGTLRAETETGVETLHAGEAIVCEPGEWVRYSTPDAPAEYIAICMPAFSPERVNRDIEPAHEEAGR